MAIIRSDYLKTAEPMKYKGLSEQFLMTNSYGDEANILSYGALVESLRIKSNNDGIKDVMLGLKDLDQYMADGNCHGSVVGRSANRIANSSFEIDGVTYKIEANEGPTNLHTGVNSFQHSFWKGEIISKEEANKAILDSNIPNIPEAEDEALMLNLTTPDMSDLFPGNLNTTVYYIWTIDRTLLILYKGVSDKKTLFAPTNHSYFNLGGHEAGNIEDNKLYVYASKVTVKDELNCPQGELMDVAGTDFDFRNGDKIKKSLYSEDMQIKPCEGIDQNYCVDEEEGSYTRVARLEDSRSDRIMEVYTDMPGIQVYAGNHLGGDRYKGSRPYVAYDAICLEAQMTPNSVNVPSFTSPLINPNEACYHACGYKFL